MPMDALRNMCEQAGFTNVRTYIQSGNVVFDTALPTSAVKVALETRLQDYCGKPVGVVLRDGEQMRYWSASGIAGNQVGLVLPVAGCLVLWLV